MSVLQVCVSLCMEATHLQRCDRVAPRTVSKPTALGLDEPQDYTHRRHARTKGKTEVAPVTCLFTRGRSPSASSVSCQCSSSGSRHAPSWRRPSTSPRVEPFPAQPCKRRPLQTERASGPDQSPRVQCESASLKCRSSSFVRSSMPRPHAHRRLAIEGQE